MSHDTRLAVIGTGAIARYLIDAIERGQAGVGRVVAIVDTVERKTHLEDVASRHECAWSTDVLDIAAYAPDIVIEAAAPQVVRQYAIPLLNQGMDLLVMSAGALVDAPFLFDLQTVLTRTHRHVYVPSGAIGGLDILRAASVTGIEEARLTTVKPTSGLCGAPWFAQHPIDLNAVTERTVVFRGSFAGAR